MAGGHVAATRIDCPCGESFMKDGNKPIQRPKEKRIQSLESAMQEFVEDKEACTGKMFQWQNYSRKWLNHD